MRAQPETLAPIARAAVAAEAIELATNAERAALKEDHMATRREIAARALGQLLTTDAIGVLLDEIGPAGVGVRDLILKAAAASRDVAVDAAEAEAMGERQRLHAGASKSVSHANVKK